MVPLQVFGNPPAIKIVHDAVQRGLDALEPRLHNGQRVGDVEETIGLFGIEDLLHAVIELLAAILIGHAPGLHEQLVDLGVAVAREVQPAGLGP